MFDSGNLSASIQSDMKIKRRSYDGFFKARVVCEWINGKGSLQELAVRYGVHPNQIKNWKTLLLKRASEVLEDKRRSRTACSEKGFRTGLGRGRGIPLDQ